MDWQAGLVMAGHGVARQGLDFSTTPRRTAMLVLTRKADQKVYVTLPDGREAWVKVIDIDGGKVRLGFEFPPDVLIMRDDATVRTPRTGKGA